MVMVGKSRRFECTGWADIEHLCMLAETNCNQAMQLVRAGQLHAGNVSRARIALARAEHACLEGRSLQRVRDALASCQEWLDRARQYDAAASAMISVARQECTAAEVAVAQGLLNAADVRRARAAVERAMAAKAGFRSLNRLAAILAAVDQWLDKAATPGAPARSRPDRDACADRHRAASGRRN